MDKTHLVWHYVCEFNQNSSFLEEYLFTIPWNNKIESRFRISSKGWDFINSKVYEAQQIYNIKEFDLQYVLTIIKNGMRNPYNKSKNYCYYWRCQNKKTTHYIKKSHHKRKEINDHELANKEWRNKKGIDKDKQKAGWNKRNAGKYYKSISNRMHRRWQKENIFHERFDEIGSDNYKFFQDPWMWD